ncbi:hypothetical protein O7635_36280 [Asanoa sp. WMMD1127]|uniref:hypothetical protein n=1 Tax=Asanoa sp. WMMD1127 TaxID=3016107 RepID=UPI00241735FA|nr:hypothetical protein [Asanoa sp. WMMD1127]MDG4827333.1 hypothetical protein [Asanoa sp. WMMD1127]
MRYVSAVALYGPKRDPLATLVSSLQEIVASFLGDAFRPYVPEQVHGTLVALNGPGGVNDYFLEHRGERRQMDYAAALSLVAAAFRTPLTVRFGAEGTFTSRGQSLRARSFSVHGGSVNLIGWPREAFDGEGRRLDALRRGMTAAGVLHRYHATPADVDDDLYLVLGHCPDADPAVVARAVAAGRDHLAARPAEVSITAADVRVVAADTPTLLPAIRSIPLAETTPDDLVALNGG